MKGNIIEICNITSAIGNGVSEKMFFFHCTRTQGHPLKRNVKRFRIPSSNFLHIPWHLLSLSVAIADDLGSFPRGIDFHRIQ